MKHQRVKIIFHLVLILSFILVIISAATESIIHPLFGAIFTVLVIIHILLHWHWFKSIPKLLKKK